VGTGVFGGMLAATVLLVLFVPVFYVVIQRASEWLQTRIWARFMGRGELEKGSE